MVPGMSCRHPGAGGGACPEQRVAGVDGGSGMFAGHRGAVRLC